MGTLRLPSMDYVKRENEAGNEGFGLCRCSAEIVGSKEKGVCGMLSLVRTVGQVAGGGALLF